MILVSACLLGLLGFVFGIFTSSFVYFYINFKNNMSSQVNDPVVMDHSGHSMPMMNSMMKNYNDLEYLNLMIIHHNDALEMADRAIKNSSNKFILELSKNIISSQSKEISEMKVEMEKIVNSK